MPPAYSCYDRRKTSSSITTAITNWVSTMSIIVSTFRSTLSFAFLTSHCVQTWLERRASWINGTSVSPLLSIVNNVKIYGLSGLFLS